MLKSFAALAALLVLCGGAHATTLFPRDRTCPVGGETFKSFAIGSTSSFGARLDLRPMGPQAHLPTVECPNGFVVFKAEEDFTPAEIATLTPVVASATYQAARQTEPIAGRTVLLMQALGTDEAGLRNVLLLAAFEAEDAGAEDLRQKYLTRAAAAYDAFVAAHPAQDEDWWVAKLRAAEIARQQSRFDDAIRIADGLASLKPPGDGWFGDVAKQIKAKAVLKDAAPAPFESPN
ncbi:MAG TPA: hypothetical protein VHZ78_04200 [Rhizomicrobium sp.]|jgi:hypothetical protein|nr:hypothetical protein [Rhizomicrobium sp.]